MAEVDPCGLQQVFAQRHHDWAVILEGRGMLKRELRVSSSNCISEKFRENTISFYPKWSSTNSLHNDDLYQEKAGSGALVHNEMIG